MIIPAPEAVAVSILNFPVYWYGIILAAAIFVSIIVANFIFNRVNCNLKKDIIISCAPLIIILGILGARLYFCSLNPAYYYTHLIEIADIRQGGLSIHGAIIFGIIGLIIAAKRNNVPPIRVLDAMACATLLGQSIGRWGNYFNSEAYGFPVKDQTWGLFIPQSHRVFEYADYSLFHPTFLYESLSDFFGFGILLLIILKYGKKYSGLTFFSYLTIYSIIRFFIEQIRVDSALNFGSLPIAEIISVLFFFIGLCGIFVCIVRHSKLSSKKK